MLQICDLIVKTAMSLFLSPFLREIWSTKIYLELYVQALEHINLKKNAHRDLLLHGRNDFFAFYDKKYKNLRLRLLR